MKRNFGLAILSGLLFSVGWPTYGFPLFLFFAFIPLLFIEEHFYQKKSNKGFFLYVYLAFFLWNLLKTWWVYNSTEVGGVFAVVVNSLLMATTFWLYHFVRKRLADKMAFPFLITIWISFEKFHLNWDFSWPWLNLGNGFSDYPIAIQWYEYTGTFGGSFWILLVNLLLFKAIVNYKKTKYKVLIIPAFWLLVPFFISLFMYNSSPEKGNKAKVLLLQPNLDPWTEKFKMSNTDLVLDLLKITDTKADVVIAPETAIAHYTEIDNFSETKAYFVLKNFVANTKTSFVTGIDFLHWFDKNEKPTETANKTKSGNYYDAYNSAIMIDLDSGFKYYHKSKLVVGAEYTPFAKVLKPIIGDYMIKFGTSMGSNVTQKNREVFKISNSKIQLAPIICYESIYGDYVTDYVKLNANLLAVITNDGWWGNTEGYKQHLSLARLRAIENRRDVVQSANTGVSAHINQKGNIVKSLGYEKRGNVLAEVHLNTFKTFYTKHGDYIARVSVFIAVLLFLYSFAKKRIHL